VVTFTDGFLHFHGRKCSFDLSRPSVLVTYLPRSHQPMHRCTVNWSMGPGAGTIKFVPYDEVDKELRRLRAQFLVAFGGWTNQKSWGGGPAVLPPITPTPSALASARRVARVGRFLFFVSLLVMAVGMGMAIVDVRSDWGLVFGAAIAMAGASFVFYRHLDRNQWAMKRLQAGRHPHPLAPDIGSHGIS
jgi:hypothetical protein